MSEFISITMGELLKQRAGEFGGTEAFVYPRLGIRKNYAEFYETCRGIARGFLELGVQKGDKVSVWATNIPEWVYLQFGLSMIGAVLVTVNTNYKAHELEYILEQSDSTTLIIMEEYRDTNFYSITRDVLKDIDSCKPGEYQSSKHPYLRNVI